MRTFSASQKYGVFMETQEKEKLQELIDLLSSFRGRHTELVTVYAPAGSNINQLANQLSSEQSTAMNIKSKTTRTNVIDALERILRQLKLHPKIPANGFAIFCGNVSKNEGQQNIQLWAIEPPQELRTKFYRCDQVFVLEPLKEMLKATGVYGLIVMDRREATIGLLEGKNVTKLKHLTSNVPGKYKTGGQCLDPRSCIQLKKGVKSLSELKIGDEIRTLDLKSDKEILTKVTNVWKKKKEEYVEICVNDCWSVISSLNHLFFKAREDEKVIEIAAKDLVVGNHLITYYDHGPTKGIDWIDITKITKHKDKIDLIDIETESKNFLANGILVHNSAARFDRLTDEMAKEFYRRISEHVKEIFLDMPRLKGLFIGGPGPTKEEFIVEGQIPPDLKKKIIAVKDLTYTDEQGLMFLVDASKDDIASEEITIEKKILKEFFEMLGKNPSKVAYEITAVKRALEMGAVQKLIISTKIPKEIAKELAAKAESISAEVYYVSDETNEGVQFKNISGLGALLRFIIG